MNRHFVPIELDGTWLLIDAPSVREILGKEPWLPIPRARAELPGVLAWRGRAVPVVDLSRVLGLPRSNGTARARTLVIQHDRGAAAIPVDAVREVRAFPAASVRELHNEKRPYTSGEVDGEGGVLAVIDLRTLISDLDRSGAREADGAA